MTPPKLISVDWTIKGMKHRFYAVKKSRGNPGHMPFCYIRQDEAPAGFGLVVFLSEHFFEDVTKQGLESSALIWKGLLNLRYSYDPRTANSRGGRDGIYNVSRRFKPKNEMVKKLYDRLIDTDKGIKELESLIQKPAVAQGVRVVSHGLRILGFVERSPSNDQVFNLVLTGVDVHKL